MEKRLDSRQWQKGVCGLGLMIFKKRLPQYLTKKSHSDRHRNGFFSSNTEGVFHLNLP